MKRILKNLEKQDRCFHCGVSIQPSLAGRVIDKEGNEYCSWYCKDEERKEKVRE